MVVIVRELKFEKAIKHIKDKKLKQRIKKQIKKIIENPEKGKFLIGNKKGERKIYISPFRLLYSYNKSKNEIHLIDFGKRDIIYKK